MFRALCLLLTFSCFAFSQDSNEAVNTSKPSSPASSPVQVFYIAAGSTLYTYNVNPQTLQATQVGTITLPESVYPNLVASPNGRFLYYTAYLNDNDQGHRLYVYDTNGDGAPGASPVQKLTAQQLSGVWVHPNGKFLYSIAVGAENQQQQTTPYSILRNLVNPENGKLSQTVTEANYTLETGSSSNNCYLWLFGFNPTGTVLYDGVLCSGPHGSGSATYNQRTVDLQTGALGPDEEIYYYSEYAAGENVVVQFANNLMFAFVSYYNQGPNANLVDVYQTSNASTPAINCSATMWVICGDFNNALAHPSGQYVFLSDTSNVTEIGAVNLNTQQISQTSSLPYDVGKFSPDGSIVYGVNETDGEWEFEIDGFDVGTGQVRQGGTVNEPSDYAGLWTAERD
jgi:hypothetical protein